MFADFAEELRWFFGGVNYPICHSDGNMGALSGNYFSGHQNV